MSFKKSLLALCVGVAFSSASSMGEEVKDVLKKYKGTYYGFGVGKAIFGSTPEENVVKISETGPTMTRRNEGKVEEGPICGLADKTPVEIVIAKDGKHDAEMIQTMGGEGVSILRCGVFEKDHFALYIILKKEFPSVNVVIVGEGFGSAPLTFNFTKAQMQAHKADILKGLSQVEIIRLPKTNLPVEEPEKKK